MKIEKLLNNIKYEKFIGDKSIEIQNFSKDTRTIEKGDIYLGIRGESFDGNSFYNTAFENAANACMLDNIEITSEIENYCTKNNKAIIVVDNTIKRLQEYATNIRKSADVPVIAITGSAGKTTTKDMVSSILKQRYNVLKSEQNYNNEIGLPLTLTRYKDEELMVLEMGTSSLGEISLLSNIAKPNISLITNIGTAHIGLFGNRDNILKAKLEITDGMSEEGILILNNDDDLLHKYYLENKNKIKIITYGINELSDYVATDIHFDEDNATFKYKETTFNVKVSGLHYIYNALACITISDMFGLSMEEIQNGLNNMELSKNRMNIVKKGNVTIINDAYNANAEAMKYAIDYLELQKGHKIAILGSMLELGDYTKELHEKVAQICIDDKIDIVLSIGEEMKYLDQYLNEKNFNIHKHFDTKEEILEYLKLNIKENDYILIKGSNGLRLFDLIDQI